jgi:hypothetical protein
VRHGSAYRLQIDIDMSPFAVRSLFEALKDGLYDYMINERGDVGSWIRIACIRGLTSFIEILFSHADGIPDFEAYLPPGLYHEAIGGILKQGVERLDGVRQEAGEHFLRLLLIPLPTVATAKLWQIQGDLLMRELFLA